ncbi:MAG TPA: hypothetical protein VGD66_08160 [Allosphingosinicella sp.]|jgi:hypothetical protein
MRPLRELRRLFSAYEIAAGATLIHWLFFGLLILLAILRRSAPALALAGLISVAAAWFAGLGVACPRCGKSVMRYHLTDWGERRGGYPWGHRVWPERTCSHCRAPLDLTGTSR